MTDRHDFLNFYLVLFFPLRLITPQEEFLRRSHPRLWLLPQHTKQASEHITHTKPPQSPRKNKCLAHLQPAFIQGRLAAHVCSFYLFIYFKKESAASRSHGLNAAASGSCLFRLSFSSPVSRWAASWKRFAVMQLYSRFSTLQKRRTMFGFSDLVQVSEKGWNGLKYIYTELFI